MLLYSVKKVNWLLVLIFNTFPGLLLILDTFISFTRSGLFVVDVLHASFVTEFLLYFITVMSQQPKTYFQNVDTHDEYNEPAAPAEMTGTLSKQFQPKKFKDGNKLWNAEQQEENYSYTPFKAATLNRTPKPTRDSVHSGTLRPPKSSPFVYAEAPPSAPTTPRMPRARPESAAGTMTREQKLTWGRPPPAAAHFRSASAMSHGRQPHPGSEFVPLSMAAPPMHPMAQRYSSYTTIPRDQMEMHAHAVPFFPHNPPQVHLKLNKHTNIAFSRCIPVHHQQFLLWVVILFLWPRWVLSFLRCSSKSLPQEPLQTNLPFKHPTSIGLRSVLFAPSRWKHLVTGYKQEYYSRSCSA